MEGTIRLNKYLSDAGICSRREADRLVEDGKVFVDGEVAVMGMQIHPGQKVVCDGKMVSEKEKPVFLIVNKPRGIVCTTSDKDHAENIVEFLNYPQRIYPVGRLDKDSEGLLLMTNQGDIVNKILRGGNAHEKEYAVAVNHPVTEEFLKQMCEGVRIEDLDVTTKPCRAWKTGSHTFHIVLTQGLNRQIRRMCRAGLGVTLLSDTVVRMSGHDEPVVFYKLDSDDVSRDIAVMWKKKRYVSKAMEEFTKLAAEMFSG